MKNAHAVIGSSFGDEGKGLLTDYFCQMYGGCLVARFNGGAQAGHTVVTADGRRHVFSHFGAGTLAGAPTLLCRRFIANPVVFERERAELAALGVEPAVFIDPRALVTTPWDMLLNEMAETARGARRHGSVGLGINETVTRSEHSPFRLTMGDAAGDPRAVEAIARCVRDVWVPRRVAALGIGEEFRRREALVRDEGLLQNWLCVLEQLLERTMVQEDARVLHDHEHAVFEGAQGLLLDQDRGTFPYVTRSNTGIRNVVEILREVPPAELSITYATRAYLTRHGAGPLDGELPGPPFPGVHDRTNVPHPFQGALRYALLDVDTLGARIRRDLADAGELAPQPGVAITCMDQLPEVAAWRCEGTTVHGSPDELVEAVRTQVGGDTFLSYGPCADDVMAEVTVG
ncbi:MAG TPA: adenylosuccinate synthetase [Longimicrobium sp.]|nr:adenylosuccinate synthetase [Longimicrobium sp.]